MLTQSRAYRSRIATFLTTLMVIWQIGQPLQAAVVYWDINGTTAGASG